MSGAHDAIASLDFLGARGGKKPVVSLRALHLMMDKPMSAYDLHCARGCTLRAARSQINWLRERNLIKMVGRESQRHHSVLPLEVYAVDFDAIERLKAEAVDRKLPRAARTKGGAQIVGPAYYRGLNWFVEWR